MSQWLTPGVYVEEVPRAPFRVEPRPTSVTALLGTCTTGPVDAPVTVRSVGEYAAAFGPGPLRRAVQDFLDNGGEHAEVVRVQVAAAALAALREAEVQLVVVEPGAVARADAHAWCEDRGAFLVDAPDQLDRLTVELPPGLGRNAAVYAPGLLDAQGAVRSPAAAVAGVIARTDRTRGVNRAPVGPVAGAFGLAAEASSADLEHASTRQLNLLRRPRRGTRGSAPEVWGARTASFDPEWRYVPVRRLVLHVERSIAESLQAVVFEPNSEALWVTVRAGIESFLFPLWTDGMLAGQTPQQAYFVRCGRDTMTASDLAAGLLRVQVGLAAVRPAEFVVVQVTQPTADAQ